MASINGKKDLRVTPKMLVHYLEIFYHFQKKVQKGTYLSERFESQYKLNIKKLKAFKRTVLEAAEYVRACNALPRKLQSGGYHIEISFEDLNKSTSFFCVNLICRDTNRKVIIHHYGM